MIISSELFRQDLVSIVVYILLDPINDILSVYPKM